MYQKPETEYPFHHKPSLLFPSHPLGLTDSPYRQPFIHMLLLFLTLSCQTLSTSLLVPSGSLTTVHVLRAEAMAWELGLVFCQGSLAHPASPPSVTFSLDQTFILKVTAEPLGG